MKGIIAYYSTTGNTALVCRFVKAQMPSIDFDLHDVTKDGGFDPAGYGIVGFATFADELRIPELMRAFISSLRTGRGSHAFVFNTFGSISGRTLNDLVRAAGLAGFGVIAAASIHMPENYPPIIKTGLAFEGQPDARQGARLRRFIDGIDAGIRRIREGKDVRTIRPSGLISMLPLPPRFLTRMQSGSFECDTEKCTRCMSCVAGCPRRAITFSDRIVVDRNACRFCWKCYNICPANAIRGTKFGSGFQYRPDAARLRERLAAILPPSR